MASTRELWILLRARDEASRVVHSFSKNVRAAALAAQAAQKSAEAAAIRQRAQMLKTNGATAQQIRAMNDHVIGLEKQARAQTAAAARAREFRAEQMKSIDSQVRANNRHAAGLEKQARALSLAASMADENRASLIRLNGSTNEATQQIDGQIAALRKRAATLNAEAAVARGASASLIAGLQEEQTGLDGSIRSYERRAAAIRAQAAVLRNQSSELKSNLDTQVRALTNQAAALDRQANSFRQAANRAREHDIAMRHLRESLGKVSEGATVAAFSLAAVGAGGLIGLKQAINTTVEYERQVRATKTQTGEFGASLQELSDVGKRVANEIAVPFEQIQPALFDVFSSMDVNVKDAEKLLKAFSKAAVAGQTDIQAVSRATIGILNAFHRPASDVNKVLDIQFQLVKLGIGTYEEWNQRIGLVTPSAVRAGQSIEMMAAALAVSTRMGISAARSGTAVSRAMDAISHPAAVKNMEELGIKVRDASGKFRPMNKILREFRDVLMKMPEKDRVAAILNVFKGAGGTIEARRFLQNILLGKGNLEAFDSVLERVQKSSGSMEDAYKTMADSTAAKTELLRNKWQLLKTAIGEALLPQFDMLIQKMSGVLDWFNKLPAGTKNTIGQFILWGSVISLVVAGLFGLIAVGAVVASAFATIGVAAGIAIGVMAAIPLVIAGIGVAFIAAWKKSETFRNTVKQVADNLKQLWDIAVDTGQGIKQSFEEHIGPPVERVWGIIKDKLLPAFREIQGMIDNEVIPKIKEAGAIIKDLADGALKHIGDEIDNHVVPAINAMSEWWDKHGESVRPVLQLLGQVAKWLLIIAAVIIGVVVVAIGGALAAAWAVAIAPMVLLVGWIILVVNWFKQLPDRVAAVGNAISGFASQVGSFFSGLWDSISNFFTQLFDWFSQLPGRIMGFIQQLPTMLGNLFRDALNRAAYAVGYGIGLIWVFFSQVVPRAIGFLATLPARLAALFVGALAAAGRAVSNGLNAIHRFFLSLPGRIVSAISSIGGRILAIFNSARTSAVNAARSLVDGAINFFRTLPERAYGALQTVHNAVLRAFAGAASWLIGAGEDIIRGVINGIGNMIGHGVDMARNAAHKMVQGFKDAIKSNSPSKVYMELGKFSMQGYAIGMVKETKNAIKTIKGMTSDIISEVSPNVMMTGRNAGPALATATAGTGRTYNQDITIYTNEIDPRKNAAELGWELERRVQ